MSRTRLGGAAPRRPLPGLHVREDEYQVTLVGALEAARWAVNHTRRAREKRKGRHGQRGEDVWLTPTSSPGWPDLVALRGPWLLACEVKQDTNYPTPEQRGWLERFLLVPGALVWVARPRDPWDRVSHWIQHPEDAPRVWGWQPAGWTEPAPGTGRYRGPPA